MSESTMSGSTVRGGPATGGGARHGEPALVPPQDAGRQGHHGDAAGHGSMRDYVVGFVLSVILTAIPFWLVMGNVLGKSNLTAIAVMALAVVQIVVHMTYFLHMNTKSEGGWTMLAFIFTVVVVVITLSGSLWVMYHLNANMMPGHHGHHDVRNMP